MSKSVVIGAAVGARTEVQIAWPIAPEHQGLLCFGVHTGATSVHTYITAAERDAIVAMLNSAEFSPPAKVEGGAA